MGADKRCMSCMRPVGEYGVCPHCGWLDNSGPAEEYHLYPGTVLSGRYQTGMAVGSDAVSISYICWDISKGKSVILREYFPRACACRYLGTSVLAVQNGEKEYNAGLKSYIKLGKALSAISGSSPLQAVLDVFEANSTAYIVMESLDGISLADYMGQNRRNIPWEDARNIIMQVSSALIIMHRAGLVHGNVCPDNIILTMGNSVKLTGFECSFVSNDRGGTSYRRGLLPVFAAPEQLSKNDCILRGDSRSDIFALSATLYYMLTSSKPADEERTEATHSEFYSPSELGVPVAKHVDEAIIKGLEADPKLRFSNLDEFIEALEGLRSIKSADSLRRSRGQKKTFLTLVAAFLLTLTASLYYVYRVLMGGMLPDSLNIWLPEYEDTERSSIMHMVFDTEGAPENSVCAAFLEEYPRIDINVRWIAEKDYAKELIDAAESESLPELFYADNVYSQFETRLHNLNSLAKKLSESGCSLMEDYNEYFPSGYYMPTSIDLAVLYSNSALCRENGISLPADGSVIENFAAALGADDKTPHRLCIRPEYSYVYGQNWQKHSYLAERSNQIEKIFPQRLDVDETPVDSYVYGSEKLISYVGSIGELRWVQSALPGYYTVSGIGDAPAYFSDLFCISESSNNKERIAENILSRLFENNIQLSMNIQGRGLMPVEDKAQEQYIGIYSDFRLISDRFAPNVLMGEDWYRIYRSPEG